MHHQNRFTLLITLVISFLCVNASAEEKPKLALSEDEQGINARLHGQLSAIQTMQSEFIQQTVDASNALVQENEGILSIATDARFVVKTQTPFEQTLVSDGDSFWTYDEALDQVIITQLDNDVNKVPILLLGNDDPSLLAAYHINWYEEDASTDDEQLILTNFVLEPKANDALFQVLSISFIDDLPREISIKDTLGQRTRITFYNTKVNETIDDAIFSFQIPPEVDVIDDRG